MMKTILKLLVCIAMVGCETKESVVLIEQADSVLIQSNKHINEYNEVIKQVDSQVAERIKFVVGEMQELEKENTRLKSDKTKIKVVNKIVRDTIYITEKKNFWGKTKRTIDSTQSIIEDSSQTENK